MNLVATSCTTSTDVSPTSWLLTDRSYPPKCVLKWVYWLILAFRTEHELTAESLWHPPPPSVLLQLGLPGMRGGIAAVVMSHLRWPLLCLSSSRCGTRADIPGRNSDVAPFQVSPTYGRHARCSLVTAPSSFVCSAPQKCGRTPLFRKHGGKRVVPDSYYCLDSCGSQLRQQPL